ncbi:MAG: hypothetical protein A2Z91_00485 [Deltaproteobacteria bacterium GWA2_38_16]|nr:MAG: hypothetical protein A2Z91_00485 [Deltaproteobacteria bacterium GWA2_38_16]OGQ03579.1 MAG: hypothetical protein A3D19_01890 [Deltaproteobacteria bacterium RIFCSPHIGHO2_02_FULL_38_15]OGQ64034.1 MAG: hypothetical protein A3G92_01150 [Deltaproteobacteria bacterium RIFCSPLOWO2_12_FULL_38_8]HBQ21178.1 DUF502 domain-containing protein [Deltaproteobacteria bacterium]
MIKFKDFLKTNFLTGFLILVPIGATYTLISIIIRKSDEVIRLLPHMLRPETYLGFPIPGLGLLLTFILIIFIGVLGRVYFGKFLIQMGENIIHKIPFISGFYAAMKQLMDTMFASSSKGGDNRKVVMVEFPRKGLYSIGFVTSVAKGETQAKTAATVVNVFVPTTPNPTSGFFFMVPQEDITPLNMSIEEAFKLIVSGGIVSPEDLHKHVPK